MTDERAMLVPFYWKDGVVDYRLALDRGVWERFWHDRFDRGTVAVFLRGFQEEAIPTDAGPKTVRFRRYRALNGGGRFGDFCYMEIADGK